MAITKSIIRTMTRMAVFLPSAFCAILGFAQTSLQERLNNVLETQNMDMGLKLYNEITEADLSQLPDSSLFDYHYLGGYLNSEIPNHEKAVSHLLEAKKICDKVLGTHSIGYMQIMSALGDEYIELRQYDDALAVYQEGIVKSMAVRKSACGAFSNLIIGVQECYEHRGWFKEIPSHLYGAWSFWTKDEEPFSTYNYYPLWRLEQFYSRYGMYDKAIAISDKIEEFITSKYGNNHPELCDALYMRGNILLKAGRRKDAISDYERAISIAQTSNISDAEILGLIYGNLIVALADEGAVEKCKEILPAIKTYSLVTTNSRFYANAIYSCALHLGQSHHYYEALTFVDMIPTEGFSANELALIKDMKNSYLHTIEILSNFDSMVNSHIHLPAGSSDWYKLSYELANVYMATGKLPQCFNMLETIYRAYMADPTNQDASPLFLMNSLLIVTAQLEDNSSYLKYALAKRDLLNGNKDIPQKDIIDNLHEIIAGQIRCQQLDGIDERLNIVENFYRTQYGEVSKDYATYLHNRGRCYQLQNKLEKAKETLLESISIQNKVNGKPLERTVKYYMEVEQQLGEL